MYKQLSLTQFLASEAVQKKKDQDLWNLSNVIWLISGEAEQHLVERGANLVHTTSSHHPSPIFLN